MPVDPQIQPLLDLINQPGMPTLSSQTPAETRALMASTAVQRDDDGLASIGDGEVAGVPVRWYRPEGADDTSPVLVWFHGGGWVIGSVETADHTASKLASLSGVTVCSVDYRLAPEHRFPAAADDCDDVVRELGANGRRIAVGGDSAGGNLAAVVCLAARERGGPEIALQVLVYPVTDLSMSQASYVENAEGYFLTADAMRWFIDHYVPDPADRKDWWCAPLHAESLAGLPAAIVITAEYDPLRDEGEAYADRLREAGVPVELVRYDGAIHGFFNLVDVDASDRARAQVGGAVRAALS
jgi:acetyl esterase